VNHNQYKILNKKISEFNNKKYESHNFNFLNSHIKKIDKKKFEIIFLDVGAYIGFYSLFFRKKKIKCFAYEPDQIILPHLKNFTSKNKYIKIFNYGLSDINGRKKLFASEFGSSGSSFNSYKKNMLEMVSKVETISKNNDNILNENSNNKKKFFFIKIDTEGHEYNILNNLKEKILQKKYKFLILTSLHLNKHEDFFLKKIKIFKILKIFLKSIKILIFYHKYTNVFLLRKNLYIPWKKYMFNNFKEYLYKYFFIAEKDIIFISKLSNNK